MRRQPSCCSAPGRPSRQLLTHDTLFGFLGPPAFVVLLPPYLISSCGLAADVILYPSGINEAHSLASHRCDRWLDNTDTRAAHVKLLITELPCSFCPGLLAKSRSCVDLRSGGAEGKVGGEAPLQDMQC